MNQSFDPNNKLGQQTGFVILVGGRSRRMKQDKWALPFGERSFLNALIEVGQQLHATTVLAVGRNQSMEQLAAHVDQPVTMIQDEVADQGPLEALRCTLRYLDQQTITRTFITGCDSPALRPEVVVRLVERLGDADAVVPHNDRHLFGLTAVYSTRVWRVAQRQLQQNLNRVTDFVRVLEARRYHIDEFRDVDPSLASFRNVNTPDELAELKRDLDTSARFNEGGQGVDP